MPITPSGTRTREICKPFGRVHEAITSPTGSGSARDVAQAASPLPRTRVSSSASRSMKASSRPLPRAASMSFLLASRIAAERASIRFGHGLERGVLLFRRGERERARGLARQAPHIEHHRLDACLRLTCQDRHSDSSTPPVQNHVVAVDQLRVATVAENLGDFTALAADDAPASSWS